MQGDVSTAGTSYISLAAGVNAIFYVAGNVNLQGNGILNNSYLPGHFVLNGIQPTANADGSFPARSITVATGQDFQGIVYAPNHDLDLALQAVSTGVATTVPTVPAYITVYVNNLEAQAVNDDGNATNAMLDYNNDMAAYVQNNKHSDYVHAQQDLARAQQYTALAAALRQQEATLLGQYSQETVEDHARGYNGIYGGFVARTIKVENKTHVHYDETLRTAGPVNHYEVVNWFEDNLSHDATGGTEAFWWPATK